MASTLQTLLKNAASKEKFKEVAEQEKVPTTTTKQYQPLPTTSKYTQPLPSTTKGSQPNTAFDNTKKLASSTGEKKVPISPVNNFTKVPNSITTEAIPQGLFKGLSKHTYDVLYKLTRGAINPTRKVQLTRFELMKLTGLSENTQRAHIKYLSVAGLVKVAYETGKHEGATYEVFVLEEISDSSTNSYQPLPSTTNDYQGQITGSNEYQNLVPVTSQQLAGVGTTNIVENKEVYENDKTLFKTTNTNDDEKIAAFAGVIEKFEAVSQKLTGKGVSKRDIEKWNDFADLIILELEVAAKRTGGVSSIPAFLTEVLRRQFFAARREGSNAITKSTKTKIDTVGKPDAVSYEIKPLDEKGKREALSNLQEFADEDFLQDFRKWYLKDDWEWLMSELRREVSK